MRPIALSDDIAVGEMPAPGQIAILAKAGFRSLLCVQPDGEVARLISAVDAAKAAEEAGLAYAYVPIESRRLSDAQVAAVADAMAGLPRPIYACCYSGARAAAAWAMAVAPVMQPEAISKACTSAGYDMSALTSDIERRHAGLPGIAPAPQPAPVDEPAPLTAPSAASAAEKIIFPRAAGAGGFAVAG